VVIVSKLGREHHSSIPATAIGRRLEPLDELTPEPDSTGEKNKINSYLLLLGSVQLLRVGLIESPSVHRRIFFFARHQTVN
jgi:hypothetical protein